MTKSISHHRSESTSVRDILSQVKTSPDSSPKSRYLEDSINRGQRKSRLEKLEEKGGVMALCPSSSSVKI